MNKIKITLKRDKVKKITIEEGLRELDLIFKGKKKHYIQSSHDKEYDVISVKKVTIKKGDLSNE